VAAAPTLVNANGMTFHEGELVVPHRADTDDFTGGGTKEYKGPIALPVAATWNGTTTVLMTNTSKSPVDSWICEDVDGWWYRVTAVDPGVSVTIDYLAEQHAIPNTGSSASSRTDSWLVKVAFTSVNGVYGNSGSITHYFLMT